MRKRELRIGGKVELYGSETIAFVRDINGSLVYIEWEDNGRCEWVDRGEIRTVLS